MSLFYNNIEIPNSRGRMYYNNVELEQVYMNGTIVWDVLDVVTEPIVYTTGVNQTWIVPDGVYALGICMVGGGEAGGAASGKGGGAGTVVSFALSVVPGQAIPIVIGHGGQWINDVNGWSHIATTATSCNGVYAIGATNEDYMGDGAPVTTCGGTTNDGTTFIDGNITYPGGQSSGFYKGGDGFNDILPGFANHGQMGSGGGAGLYLKTDGYYLLSLGGNGVVRLSFNQPV